MHGSGQRDVRRVVLITCTSYIIRRLPITAIVRNTRRREGEGLDATGGTITGATVEVDADIDRIFLHRVGDFHTLLERLKNVRLARHDDLEALGLKLLFHDAGNLDVVARLGAVRIDGAWVLTTVPRIEDDRAEISCVLDEFGRRTGSINFPRSTRET